jgi:hypothetical protein
VPLTYIPSNPCNEFSAPRTVYPPLRWIFGDVSPKYLVTGGVEAEVHARKPYGSMMVNVQAWAGERVVRPEGEM